MERRIKTHLETSEPIVIGAYPHILHVSPSFLQVSLQHLKVSIPHAMTAAGVWKLAYVITDGTVIALLLGFEVKECCAPDTAAHKQQGCY